MNLEQALADKVLDKEIHSRLLAELPHVVALAGIPTDAIYTSIVGQTSDSVIEWVKSVRVQRGGLVLVGDRKLPIETEMTAITAACLRNYIDARMMSLHKIFRTMGEAATTSSSILLIPNFYVSRQDDTKIPQWQALQLLDLLIGRLAADKLSILYVQDWKGLVKDYGPAMKKHLESHYSIMVD